MSKCAKRAVKCWLLSHEVGDKPFLLWLQSFFQNQDIAPGMAWNLLDRVWLLQQRTYATTTILTLITKCLELVDKQHIHNTFNSLTISDKYNLNLNEQKNECNKWKPKARKIYKVFLSNDKMSLNFLCCKGKEVQKNILKISSTSTKS